MSEKISKAELTLFSNFDRYIDHMVRFKPSGAGRIHVTRLQMKVLDEIKEKVKKGLTVPVDFSRDPPEYRGFRIERFDG